MGQEIAKSRFSAADFRRFRQALKEETNLLSEWINKGKLADDGLRFGLELEAWLIDGHGSPAPLSDRVLGNTTDPRVENELALFNLEINTDVRDLLNAPFAALSNELSKRLLNAQEAAQQEDAAVCLIGILPSASEADVSLDKMTPSPRYSALNEQVLALRNGRPLALNIEGTEQISTTRTDVMLEAMTTSLQLHLQLPADRASYYFNAAIALSAATVAAAANSPYFFGRRLWEETRIPVFEQAVAVTQLEPGGAGTLARVGFGSGYARDSLLDFFIENRQHHPVLLPMLLDTPHEQLAHLRLHNGTIWRWNRPLVETTEAGCQLRLEHRVMAAGPTISDVIANAAFFYGAVAELAESEKRLIERLPFHVAEQNFYRAARYGLSAEVEWLDGWYGTVRELILDKLLPAARRGLARAAVNMKDAGEHLKVIEQRVASGQTGAAWQANWVAKHGHDMQALTLAYLEQSRSGKPVHTWQL
ncbi:glutamate-cysteine ligase family protein [Halorhodospira halochloris]|uniref:glutamate-cysteine ligase family protein n=1 Tax=Halorhodospira halochloris TaxID=1052 RepID=UPI001EE811E8|nr:glutamate-cysteine ligase family protein [Halorhodospira halochloris]